MFKYYLFIVVIWILSMTVLVVGFSMAGNPFDQKNVQADRRKIEQIRMLYYAVGNYSRTNLKLPPSLSVLKQQDASLNTTDPDTGSDFAYTISSKNEFKICTTFKTEFADKSNLRKTSGSPVGFPEGYPHKRGNDCLPLSVQINY